MSTKTNNKATKKTSFYDVPPASDKSIRKRVNRVTSVLVFDDSLKTFSAFIADINCAVCTVKIGHLFTLCVTIDPSYQQQLLIRLE